jgi:hypothetical protein
MGARNKKKLKRLNLLEMPNHERIQLIKEVREKLRQKTVEAKLWQSLLEAESLTINGDVVYKSNQPLHGFTL